VTAFIEEHQTKALQVTNTNKAIYGQRLFYDCKFMILCLLGSKQTVPQWHRMATTVFQNKII